MPGSWEVLERHKVMCAILHTEVTTMAWAFGIRNLQLPGVILPVAGMPYDHARNEAVRIFLSHGMYQYLFFLDSDVVPPNDAVLRLLSHRLPIVSGMYCRRSNPQAIPVMQKNGQWHTNFPLNSLQEVDVVGAGCLLVHRHIFEKIPPQDDCHPWFWWKVDMGHKLPPGEGTSEDFSWCQHVRKYGQKIMVDTSVKCRHVGLAEADYGTFSPCNHTPLT